eukprot:1058018-Pelagomonas_calceolata.AAC.7
MLVFWTARRSKHACAMNQQDVIKQAQQTNRRVESGEAKALVCWRHGSRSSQSTSLQGSWSKPVNITPALVLALTLSSRSKLAEL